VASEIQGKFLIDQMNKYYFGIFRDDYTCKAIPHNRWFYETYGFDYEYVYFTGFKKLTVINDFGDYDFNQIVDIIEEKFVKN
jgi:hypothetical protein